MRFAPKRILRGGLDLPRLYYKELAGAKPALCNSDVTGEGVTMLEAESIRQEPQFAAFVSIDWADKKHV
jgi:hypothetical protein